MNKDELPSNQDNAFRDTHGKPVLVLNAKKQLCVALLPDEIYPRWLGSTWQRYVTKKEREEYEQTCLAFSQGLLAVLVSLFLQVFTGVLHLIQATRQKSLIHAREESQETRLFAKKSQPFFFGWKEKVALPVLLCLLVFGSFWSVWRTDTPNVSREVSSNESKQESPLAVIENRMTQYKKSRIASPINRGFCSESLRIQMFASVTYFEMNNSGVKTPQMIIDTPP